MGLHWGFVGVYRVLVMGCLMFALQIIQRNLGCCIGSMVFCDNLSVNHVEL